MTHYWWMHWFWITCWIYIVCCEAALTTLHSSITETPLINVSNDSSRSAKAIGGSSVHIPPITLRPSATAAKNLSNTSNIAPPKFHKTSLKKFDLHPVNKEMTVINQNNVTDISVNITDNQTLITNFSALNHTDNLTYLDEDVNCNQSFVQNPERIGVELTDDLEVSGNLSAAGITGITLGCVIVVGIICGVSYFLYRNRGFNRPQVLNDRCSNPDSSGYIDDASVRDNSEEMYSLDNDSFLNSLEAMTIQNYWTDTVKHTKL